MRKLPYRTHLPLLLWLVFLLPPAQAEENGATVLILGDSISAAYGMSLEQGWVALLKRRLAEDGIAANIINASISGETSGGALRRLPALLADYTPTLVIVELGGNDGLRGFSLTTLRKNLGEIVSQAQADGAQVLLLPMEIPPNYGHRYTLGFRETFVQVAKDTGATLGPFILGTFATDASMKQPDGIHPTVAAQPLMLDAVYNHITAMLSGE